MYETQFNAKMTSASPLSDIHVESDAVWRGLGLMKLEYKSPKPELERTKDYIRVCHQHLNTSRNSTWFEAMIALMARLSIDYRDVIETAQTLPSMCPLKTTALYQTLYKTTQLKMRIEKLFNNQPRSITSEVCHAMADEWGTTVHKMKCVLESQKFDHPL
jgi:hypothetical protein